MTILEYLLSSIIVTITPLIFIKIVLNPQVRKNKKKIFIAFMVSLMSIILIYKYTHGIYRSILASITSIIMINNSFKIELNKTIILMVLYMLFLTIPDFLFLYILVVFFKIPRDYCYNVLSGSMISNIVICTLMILLTIVIKRILNKLMKAEFKYNVKIIIFSILTLTSVLVFFYDIIANFRIGSRITFYVIAMFTFILALVIVIFEENKNLKLKTEYEKLLDFMQIYEEEIEKERIIKHEYKNQLITIKSKIIDNDNENKIIDYINNVIEDESSFAQEEYTKFQYLPPNGLKALLYFKVASVKAKNINVSINISPSVKDSFLTELTTKDFKDLGILLGVFIDNAIEASINSDKKLLGLEIYEENNKIIIIISNSYTGQINTNKIGKEHFSTKGKGRGYGLLLVKKILKHNNRFECEKEITSSLYIQNIIIKNSEE